MPTDSIPELRLARVETLYAKRQWKEVHEFLCSQKDESGEEEAERQELPASLKLFDALARIEGDLPTGDDEPSPVQDLISSMESLLGVPKGNPLALLLAKRLIRKPPVTKRTTSWKMSVVSIALALTIGLGAGWALFTYAPDLVVLEGKRAE